MATDSVRSSNNGLRTVGLNSVAYLIGDVITRGSTFLLIPVYTRFLLPAEYGMLGILLSLVSLFSILFPLQLGSALTVNYFQVSESKRRELTTVLLVLTLISSMCMFFFLSLGGRWLGIIFKGLSYSNFLLAIGISMFAGFVSVPQTLMRLRQNARNLVSLNVFFYLLGVTIGAVLLIQFDFGVSGLLLGILLSNAASVIPYILFIRGDLVAKFPVEIVYKSIVLSLPIVAHMLSHWGLNLMDRIILQAYLPMTDVGIYQLGYQLGAVFQIIIIALNSAWTPFFLENINQEEQLHHIKRLTTWLVFIQIWIALALVLLLPIMIRWLVPREYYASTEIVFWVVLGFLFVGFYQFWVNIIFYYKKTAVVPLATMIAAAANMILNLLLIPHFGYVAAAINTTISYIILAGITYTFARRIHSFPFEYPRWVKASIVGACLYGMAIMIGKINLDFSIPLNMLTVLIYPLVLYFIAFWTDDEIQIFKSWITKLFL